MSRRRIVLLAESGSLAHVARCAVLGSTLDPARFDVVLATDERYRRFFGATNGIRFHPFEGVTPARFARATERGGIVLQPEEIEQDIQRELALYEQLHPDAVLTDFRHSVPMSASLAGIPSIALSNIHWSPYRQLGFDPIAPIPRPPLLERVRASLGGERYKSATASFNEVRRRLGLAPLNSYLDVCTAGDFALYADAETFVETAGLPPSHGFVGPLVWSPVFPFPDWWDSLPADVPAIYVTLGSTGAAGRLLEIIPSLGAVRANFLIATAGRLQVSNPPPNVYLSDYLPGSEACARASLVVCNGGSGTAYQALMNDVPVLGIWSNIDQFLTMGILERRRAGMAIYAARAGRETLPLAIDQLLRDESVRSGAAEVGALFRAQRTGTLFTGFLDTRVFPSR